MACHLVLASIGLPFPSLGGLPRSGIEPLSLALVGSFYTTEPPEKLIVEYYLDIKKNEIAPFATAWMNLEIIILSKPQKYKYHILSLKYGI